MHGTECVRKWFRTAEPLGECRYEIWNTHTRQVSKNRHSWFKQHFIQISLFKSSPESVLIITGQLRPMVGWCDGAG